MNIKRGVLMEHHALKKVGNCLNTNIYSYLETSGASTIKALRIRNLRIP